MRGGGSRRVSRRSSSTTMRVSPMRNAGSRSRRVCPKVRFSRLLFWVDQYLIPHLAGSPLACAILTAVKGVLAESPRFVRYQNELASTLAGVSSAAANSKGLSILRVLLATAPPLDAPIIFLPQQRSMFLIQKISSWVASDDEIGDELYSGVAELFVHLAPIVQELSGGHWDLIFDIIESNLEVRSAFPPFFRWSC